jgi:cytochrome c biogenesis protein CcmG, thiol:disulfide interchange protein DsbE
MAISANMQVPGFLILIVTIIGAPEPSRAAVAELLQQLKLTAYSRSTIPPELKGRAVDGGEISLASLQGKLVLLNFWATWCLECRPEMPALERVHREFSAQGLAVIGINAREGAAAVREYAKELGLTFPLILDSSGKINSTYGVIGLPTTFLIGRDGRAVALAIGPREWSGKPARELFQALLVDSPLPESRR